MNPSNHAVKLALGTAQFGLPYGVANRTGQVVPDEAATILQTARMAGMRVIDTAASYGDSELVLGSLDLADFSIVTKLPAMPADCPNVGEWVRAQLADSLRRLRVQSIYGLMLHQPAQLLGPQGDALYASLLDIRARGLVQRVGISIYEPGELDALFDRFRFDLVQAPFNVMDRRLVTSGWLDRLHQLGCEVHVRSAFMQGLLLMSAAERPAKFGRWSRHWTNWDAWLQDVGQSPVAACLGFVLAEPRIGKVIVGVDSVHQLRAILGSVPAQYIAVPGEMECLDAELLNPFLWSKL